MEDKNELSDIILEEKEDNKMMKVKRILIIAALLTLIFLVILIVMKVLNNNDPQEETTKLVLPPEPQVKQVETQKEDDNLFKQVPIIEEDSKKESFEEMVKSLKEKEINKQNQDNQTTTTAQEQTQETPQEASAKKDVPKEETPAQEAKPAAAKPSDTVASQTDTNATTGYYIQVGATTKLSPDKKYLDNLAKKNYSYRLLAIDVNGKSVTKILVGPYNSSTEAKTALNGVKSSINKNAFIYRVK